MKENTCMHKIRDKKFYLGPEFGLLINKRWITISELLHASSAPQIVSARVAMRAGLPRSGRQAQVAHAEMGQLAPP
jgi:hypothetical protein